MSLEILYPLVTEAIRRAETLEDLGAPDAHLAYRAVSFFEEKITELLPVSNPEGALARRGAVRAALAARDPTQAQKLAERFLSEAGIDSELGVDLLQLLKQYQQSVADRFPLVADKYGIPEVQRLALVFHQQGAPFPID